MSDSGIARFEGLDGRRRLREALRRQMLVAGDAGVAEAIAANGELFEVQPGDVVIAEGAFTNDLFLILAGAVIVRVKGSEVARRGAGDHIGEQALLDPSQKRTASVVAAEPSVLMRLTEAQIDDIAGKQPVVWKNIAHELSRRLIGRSDVVKPRNEQIQVLVACSSDNLWMAEAIGARLNDKATLCTPWTGGLLRSSPDSIEAFEAALDDKDFAIAVAAPEESRDDLGFELGLFMGRLGRRRAILLEAREEIVKLPSDLAGLTTVPYRSGPREKLPALLAPACKDIRRIIDELKARA